MLTEVKNNYKSILKYFDFDESISSVDYQKQKLIEMAKNGEPRPSQRTKEGQVLSRYTCKSGKSYCLKFHKIIRDLAPFWFVSRSILMKQKLTQMAKNDEDRPSRKTKEGIALRDYTRKASQSYCPKFDKTIRKLRPDWFKSFRSDQMKQKLTQMAKNGEDKPHRKTKEGKALANYTYESSSSYCVNFDKLIKKLRPDWFIKSSDLTKQKLIKLAKSGAKRPRHKTKEGRALSIYTGKSSQSYCPKFDKTIRKLRPDWFIESSDLTKQELIKMAKNGEPKPYWKTKLAGKLSSYTTKSSQVYCPEFDKTIRKLRPDWFRTKKKLLKEKFKMENNMITCKEVVDRFVSAQNPAYKAHATRMLNAYVVQQCSTTGANPTQIIAGVRAAITKRKRCL